MSIEQQCCVVVSLFMLLTHFSWLSNNFILFHKQSPKFEVLLILNFTKLYNICKCTFSSLWTLSPPSLALQAWVGLGLL